MGITSSSLNFRQIRWSCVLCTLVDSFKRPSKSKPTDKIKLPSTTSLKKTSPILFTKSLLTQMMFSVPRWLVHSQKMFFSITIIQWLYFHSSFNNGNSIYWAKLIFKWSVYSLQRIVFFCMSTWKKAQRLQEFKFFVKMKN